MSQKREKLGKIASDLLQKEPESRDPIELEREMHKDYEENVIECIRQHQNIFPGDFYVVVLTKNERVMANVFRNFFFARVSCPSPEYDQAVYRYTRIDDLVDFLWVIPSKPAVEYLKQNKAYIDPGEYDLLKFVLDFEDGTLLRISKRLNGEKIGSNITNLLEI